MTFGSRQDFMKVRGASSAPRNVFKVWRGRLSHSRLEMRANRDEFRSPHSRWHRLKRALWTAVWALCYRPSPRVLHGWRCFLLRIFGGKIGKNAHPYPTAKIWAPWNLEMGDHSCLGDHVDCYCVGNITIGSYATISQYSYLCSASHDYTDPAMPLVTAPIVIGNRAWIAADAFVGPGVTVGEGAVVGARSSVFSDAEPWTIVVGNPARFLKARARGARSASTTTQRQRAVRLTVSGYQYSDGNLNESHEYLLPALVSMLNSLDAPMKRVFELGCGNGSVAAAMTMLGYDVTGIDASEQAITQANLHHPELKLKLGSAYDDLASLYGQFPIVVSLEVIEHLYFPRKFAATVYDLLLPGGVAIISTPYHGYLKNLALALTGRMDEHFTALWDHGHIKFWSIRSLSALLKEIGFTVEQVSRVGRIPALGKSMIAVVRKETS